MSVGLRVCLLAALLFLGAPGNAVCQSEPRPADVATLDGIIKAYYEVVSGPAGQPRDWARDSSLHHAEAQVLIVGSDADGRPTPQVMTLGDFHLRSNDLAEAGFFEYEIHRKTQIHGAIAHVWSTYEWQTREDGPVGGRGINSIQLVFDGKRWWITSWMFDGRSDAPPVPPEYLPAKGRSEAAPSQPRGESVLWRTDRVDPDVG